MKNRRIGAVEVSAIGLGGMPMSIEGRPDDENRSIRTIHAALDAGVTLIDTADAYHQYADEVGHNESLIARALGSYGGDTSDVLVATKGGMVRPGDGTWGTDGRPEQIRAACEASLKRLGVDSIGLYQHHRPDPSVPYADSIGAVRDLLDEGKIQMAGISNANPDQIRQAQEILGGRLVSVQNQFSPRSAAPSRNYCSATSWGSRSCPGPRWAGSPRRASWATGSSRSPTWPPPGASARSRSAWPGTWPSRRWSSRSPARAGRSRSSTRWPPPP